MKIVKLLLCMVLLMSTLTMSFSSVKAEELKSAYNIRDDEVGLIKDLKNHYANMSWSYSLSYAMDINIRKKNLVQLNDNGLSPHHLTYYSQRFVSDPLGGTENDNTTRCLYGMQNLPTEIEQVMSALMTWGAGPVHQNEMTYIADRNNTVEESYDKRIATPYKAVLFETEDIKDIQQFIYEQGAVVGEFNYSAAGMDTYSEEYDAQYRSEFAKPDQVITIIGWDDNFSKENFNPANQPKKDGAWFCRDTRNNASEYKWISYYDESLGEIWGIEVVDRSQYDNNYQYDGATENDVALSYNNSNMTQANVFTIKANKGKKEQVKAVHFDTNQRNIRYTIQLYKNPSLDNPTDGEPLLSKEITGTFKQNGKYTIDLNERVILNDGDRFSVVVRFDSLDNQSVNIPTEINSSSIEGQSYYTNDNIYGWNKLINDGNVRIKAFTSNIDEDLEEIKVTDIILNETETKLAVGEEKHIQVNVVPSDATDQRLSYESDNEDVVSIENGVIQANSVGTATITIRSLSSLDVVKMYRIAVVKRFVPVEELILSSKEVNLKVGESQKLDIQILPADADNKDIVYKSNNNSVQVLDDGTIIALKEGTAIITVTSHNGIEETCRVNVEKLEVPIQSITLSHESIELNENEEMTLDAEIYPMETTMSKELTYVSSDENVLVVENGKVKAIKEGVAIITVFTLNGIEAKCEVKVNAHLKPVPPVIEPAKNGWEKVDGKWYFFVEDVAQIGWVKDNGKWYFMDESGIMQTGWIKDNNKWYYLNSHMLTGWQKIDNQWYYLNTHMITGWLNDNGKWYYLDPTMKTGWIKDSGKWYYMNSHMMSGWQLVNGTWYYLNNAMVTGWLKVNNVWYYFASNGAMVTGTVTINGKVEKFNSNGAWLG